jgi:hypothetical protein
MAVTTYPAFTPTGRAQLGATPTSANVALSTTGSPDQARITNLGQNVAFVVLGTTSAVVATGATGVTILPGTSFTLALGSNTYLAAITLDGGTALNVDLGS